MSSKVKNVYICSNCDAQSPKWSGRCLECGSWGTFSLQVASDEKKTGTVIEIESADIIDLAKITEANKERIKTGILELDRVLGGGIVPGSLILLGGEPGIGKSTIVAQMADRVGKLGKGVVYASGEESASQVKGRLIRLNCDFSNIKFISETNVEKIIGAVKKEKADIVIIDSIQTVYSMECPSEAGSISQIRASAVKFLEMAKKQDITVLLIGHITKDGQLAGPKSLEHIVDTVIYLEAETAHDYRILRAQKNRFGSVNELGIFEMTGEGFREILNPSSIFVESSHEKIAGSVISCIMEGTRPFLINIQALVSKTIFGIPARKASGFDLNRLQVLSTVLTKKTKVNLINQDVILNIVGGLKVNDPSMDLAVCLSIASSLLNKVIDNKTIVLGEVGLGGEVRNVSKLEARLKEAEKLGFKKAIIPDMNVKVEKLEIKKIKNVDELLKF